MTDNNDKGILEKILLTGIGAMALTAEKAKELINEMIAKGALTVEEGKAINEELKHAMKTRRDENKFKTSLDNLDTFDADQLAALKARILDLEQRHTSDS